MLYKIYQKQVEAWKERFDEKFGIFEQVSEDEVDGTFAIPADKERVKSFALSSRHKDTIELLEAIIKEVEAEIRQQQILRKEANMHPYGADEYDYATIVLSDLLTKLQAEKELIEKE